MDKTSLCKPPEEKENIYTNLLPESKYVEDKADSASNVSKKEEDKDGKVMALSRQLEEKEAEVRVLRARIKWLAVVLAIVSVIAIAGVIAAAVLTSQNTADCDGVADISNGECLELEGGGTINKCYVGWFGEDCSRDVDECQYPELNNCDVNADCINSEGSCNCTCMPGYTGDGYSCDIDRRCSACDSTCDLATAYTNLALEKTVTMMTSSKDSTNLVDGNEATLFKSTSETSPSFTIDLGAVHCVHSVTTVKNPSSGTFEDIAINIGLGVSSVSDLLSNICVYESGATADTEEFVCAARMTGRYVRITARDVSDVISLFEVYVKGWTV